MAKPVKTGLYIVWSPTGEAPPKVSHASHGSACHAAHKLAGEHPGQTFYVMRRSGEPALVEAQTAEQVPG